MPVGVNTPLAARIVSGQPQPWSGISGLEKNDLTCDYSSFLNVCVAHMYSNV